jgi:hypothetical protein
MIVLTEVENRMQAHGTTIDRVNRQGWHRDPGRTGDRCAAGIRARRGCRLVGAVEVVPVLCRAAGRLLVLPNHREVHPS